MVRKALPRPGTSVLIQDHGNAGNLMFGDAPGSLWAIDPEMQTKINDSRETDYKNALISIINEILQDDELLASNKAVDVLFFAQNPSFVGILDTRFVVITR